MIKRRRIIGIGVILLTAALVFGWEKWGKDALMYEEIPVLRNNVEAGTVISEDDLEYIRYNREGLDFIEKKDAEKLFGMETAHFVHGGVPLFKEYFRNPRLSGNMEKGRFQLRLSSDWIDSVSEDVKRGSAVNIYTGGSYVTAAYAASGWEDGRGVDIIAGEGQIKDIGEIVASGGKLILVKG